MADLTVLISPSPIYPHPKPAGFGRFSRRYDSPVSRPIMVTLEMAADTSSSAPTSPTSSTPSPLRNDALLSPPRNTFKRPKKAQQALPPRPVSAPPQRTTFNLDKADNKEDLTPPKSSRGLFERRRLSSFAHTSSAKAGELIRPAPPLCENSLLIHLRLALIILLLVRPTTFWRKTRRSGVTGASYSPSSHLIRRSTFIAAGLSLDKPIADLSALCVESRVGFVVLAPEHELQ